MLNVNYDREQTGSNSQEKILSPLTDWTKFGKVGTFPVDGQVYAQPLYVSGVPINGATYNVLFVATMRNSVFAFNADTPQSATPLWQVNFGAPVPIGLFNFTDVSPAIGILGTPVIDAAKQILYVVADILPPGAFSSPVFELHALSLVDGQEMLGGPVQIAASVPGNGAGSSNGIVAFNAFAQMQRPGLVLSGGTLYIAFGSHGDAGDYQGWILAYDASSLKQTAVFNSAPNGRQGSFWQSGRAPAIADNGDLYAVTANGDYDGASNFSESVLHLAAGKLSLLDWYTPNEWSNLNDQDWDFGSVGDILIPNTSLVLAASKAGMLYLIQNSSMGHLGPDNTSTVQGVQVNDWGLFTMALWPAAPTGPTVYEFQPFGSLKAFQIKNNQINSTLLSEYTSPKSSLYSGLSISSNGGQGGIVWLTTGDYTVNNAPGTLRALDATNLAHELWNSDLNTHDQLGWAAKFVGPTVANGRVYVPTFSNAVAVYGATTSTPPASSAISAIVNSASYLPGPIAPGELVTLFGANLGPSSAAEAGIDGDTISDNIENTQILIGGTPSPILFASSTQINVAVPFGVTGTSTQVQVIYQGQPVASSTVDVQPASPAVFALDGSGGGQGAILNQDGSVNTSTNAASRGSVVAIFATGAGLTTPASEDGHLTAAPYPAPVLPVSVTIDGKPAQIVYVGAAPGLIAGALQIDAVVPADAQQEYYDQVVVTVGDYVSPSAVTITVQ